MEKIESNLSGSQIIDRLRKGHVVRRACWVSDFYIRICNERGYDENGNAITKGSIYTISTEGYFHHVGYSSQPIKNPKVFQQTENVWMVADRDTEGLQSLFADDWEDYGFMSQDDFDSLIKRLKVIVRENVEKAKRNSIRRAKKLQRQN